jgi:hypothetical protein
MTTTEQARNAYPAMRIFIFGQEVTEDVLSCTCSWADDTKAPSTATFTVANHLDRYTITPPDMGTLFPRDLGLRLPDLKLPDLEEMLATDPKLRSIRGEYSIYDVDPSKDPEFAARRNEVVGVHQTETLTRIAAREDTIMQEIKRRIDTQVQTFRDASGRPNTAKRDVLRAKFERKVRISQPNIDETGKAPINDPRRAAYLQGQAFRYPFFVGRPIFHSMDPVRIFWRDPFQLNPTVWYYMFTGFISDWTRSVTADNVKTVTFQCEDVMRLLRYARIAANPGIIDIRTLALAEDFVFRTFFGEDFLNLSLTEILYTIIFGPKSAGTVSRIAASGPQREALENAGDVTMSRYSVNGESQQSVPRDGVGAFDFERSLTCVFGPKDRVPDRLSGGKPTFKEIKDREVRLVGDNALAIYQSIVDHQVRVEDLVDRKLDRGLISVGKSAWQTTIPDEFFLNAPQDARSGEVSIDRVIDIIGQNPHLYPVDNGRLVILAPASLGPNLNRKIIEFDVGRGPELKTTFKNRLFVILNFMKRLEFSFYATPKGDLVAEMPLYDFDPDDFGTEPVTAAVLKEAGRDVRSSIRDVIKRSGALNATGPFAPHYKVDLRNTMDNNQAFADEHVRTQMRCSPFTVQSARFVGQREDVPAQVVTLRSLVPQFGARLDTTDPPAYVASPEAAQVYAHLRLNIHNAEALTSQVDMLPQLRLGPNRPIRVADGTYVATVRSVERTLDWDGMDMNQTVGLNYTRVWAGQTPVGSFGGDSLIYEPIGGMASRPMNYKALFKAGVFGSSSKERGKA